MAALVGACVGFMPYNMNPAKMFMGDTGATFLGYILATMSIQGLFKFYAIISFAVPFLILGLPIFDTAFASSAASPTARAPCTPTGATSTTGSSTWAEPEAGGGYSVRDLCHPGLERRGADYQRGGPGHAAVPGAVPSWQWWPPGWCSPRRSRRSCTKSWRS